MELQGSPSTDGAIYHDSYQQATTIVAALDLAPASVGATGESRSVAVVQAAASSPNSGQPDQAARRVSSMGGYQNGRIPSIAICPVCSAPTLQLECGAATAFDQLNTAFRAALEQNIAITDGYRSYDSRTRRSLPRHWVREWHRPLRVHVLEADELDTIKLCVEGSTVVSLASFDQEVEFHISSGADVRRSARYLGRVIGCQDFAIKRRLPVPACRTSIRFAVSAL